MKYFLFFLTLVSLLFADDRPQWGEQYSRNMVSTETGLVDRFNIETGENIKWKVRLGSQSYSTPVISNGRVFIGTNNNEPRDDKHRGDRGVLFCLDEKDGRLLWQLVVPKLDWDIYLDWPAEGICSPATVEGDVVYIVSNRGEVMCLDINGMADGNDGPYRDEGKHMTVDGEPELTPGPLDADILWLYDIRAESKIHQHDGAHSSILIHGDFLYLNTSTGVDNTHEVIRAPDAPSLIVLDKKSGKLVAQDNEKIGEQIFHSTWSSPALARINNRTHIIFGGGDGILYGFQALSSRPNSVQFLKKQWWFDGDPTAPKDSIHTYLKNRKESPSTIQSVPVYNNGKVFYTLGGDIWWGKRQAWLKCVDVSKTGDLTTSAEIWSYDLNRHCCATPAVSNGLVFVGDCGETIHCVDASTGAVYWTHECDGDFWASPLVADGKVYFGSRRGEVLIFEASKTKNLMFETKLDSEINATPVAANGVLYLATMNYLYAIAE